MRRIPLAAFEAWGNIPACKHISEIKRGRQVDCIMLVRSDSSDNRWAPLRTVTECLDSSFSPCLSIAVRSFSALPRVVMAQGRVEGNHLQFDCRPTNVPEEFDLEGDVPRCVHPREGAVCVELYAVLSNGGEEPEFDCEIIADIDLVRGEKDEMIHRASIILEK